MKDSKKGKQEYLREMMYLLILMIKPGRNHMTHPIVMDPDLKVRLMTVF